MRQDSRRAHQPIRRARDDHSSFNWSYSAYDPSGCVDSHQVVLFAWDSRGSNTHRSCLGALETRYFLGLTPTLLLLHEVLPEPPDRFAQFLVFCSPSLLVSLEVRADCPLCL